MLRDSRTMLAMLMAKYNPELPVSPILEDSAEPLTDYLDVSKSCFEN